MIISQTEIAIPSAQHVSVTEHTLTVDLEDGRTLSAPLGWYPRLANATPEEREHWRLVGCGSGIHWDVSTKTSASKSCSSANGPARARDRSRDG